MLRSLRRALAATVALAAAPASAAAPATATDMAGDCLPRGPARPLCGFQHPEDLAALPGGQALLVSEYGTLEGKEPGRIALLVLASDARRVLFRGGDASGAPAPGWGDASCSGPPSPAFSPHGIGLARRPDGALALAVVQHGGRESVELFELSGGGSDWKLAWRGCLQAPPDAWLNDAAWLPDGDLVVSHMMSRSAGFDAMARGEPHEGHALRWRAGRGFREIPGTRGQLVNGVEVSPDGKKLFLNVTNSGEVRRIDLATGTVEATARVARPDNSSWSPDGRLLVASLRPREGNKDWEACQDPAGGACPIPYAIVAVDPQTMQTEDLYVGADALMGAGTIGVVVGHDLFIGSFAGNRLLRVTLE